MAGTTRMASTASLCVALPNDRGLLELKNFLGRTARLLGENCLYVEVAGGGAAAVCDECGRRRGLRGLCA